MLVDRTESRSKKPQHQRSTQAHGREEKLHGLNASRRLSSCNGSHDARSRKREDKHEDCHMLICLCYDRRDEKILEYVSRDCDPEQKILFLDGSTAVSTQWCADYSVLLVHDSVDIHGDADADSDKFTCDIEPLEEPFLSPKDEVDFAEGARQKEKVARNSRIPIHNGMGCGPKENQSRESGKNVRLCDGDVAWVDGVLNSDNESSGYLPQSAKLEYHRDIATLPSDSQQESHFMGHGERGRCLDYQKVQNEYSAAGHSMLPPQTMQLTDNNSEVVDCAERPWHVSENCQEQLLGDVLRCTSAKLDPAEISCAYKFDRGNFRGPQDRPRALDSQLTRRETIDLMPRQSLSTSFQGPGMPLEASTHPWSQLPNHATHDLFPKNLSSILRRQQRTVTGDINHRELNEVQQLGRFAKRLRTNEGFGDVSGPGCSEQATFTSGAAAATSSSPYRRAPLHHGQVHARGMLVANPSCVKSSQNLHASLRFPDGSVNHLHPMASPCPAKLSTFDASAGAIALSERDFRDSLRMQSLLQGYWSYTPESNGFQHESNMAGAEEYIFARNEILDIVEARQRISSRMLVGAPQSSLGPASLFSPPPHGWQFLIDRKRRMPQPNGELHMPSAVSTSRWGSTFVKPRILHDSEQQLDVQGDGDEPWKPNSSAPEIGRRLLIQKLLTATDVGSLGRIVLPKKEAETHMPHLEEKENIKIRMFDYGADQTWTLKYRYWPNNKSRMYLLENTGDFAKFHTLEQGDWIYIYRGNSNHYVLRAEKKSPVAKVLPASQSVSRPASADLPSANDGVVPAASPERAKVLSTFRPDGGTIMIGDDGGTGNDIVVPET